MLKDQMRTQGELLFRLRSYLPILLLPLAVPALLESDYFVRWFGEYAEEAWEVGCIALSLCGLLLRALTVGFAPDGTSGRNTSEQRADLLNTTGIYSIVRNPLYLGNFLIFVGFVLAIKIWWLVVLACLCFALYYERIIYAEEAFLQRKFGTTYTEWAARTPAFLPNPLLWRASALPFSFRKVLRCEYNGFFLIVVVYTGLELLHDLLLLREPVGTWLRGEYPWLIFLGLGAAVFMTLRTLKKRTRILRTPPNSLYRSGSNMRR